MIHFLYYNIKYNTYVIIIFTECIGKIVDYYINISVNS